VWYNSRFPQAHKTCEKGVEVEEMAKSRKGEKLAAVKQMLADKWLRRAEAVKSKPERETLLRRVAKYRRQAADLLRM
jgi:hypothetical protein